MGLFKRALGAVIRKAAGAFQGNSLSQDSCSAEGTAPVAVEASDVLRRAAGEGIVLLRNEDVLPLAPDTRVALHFSRS